jgi:hypothetical protein
MNTLKYFNCICSCSIIYIICFNCLFLKLALLNKQKLENLTNARHFQSDNTISSCNKILNNNHIFSTFIFTSTQHSNKPPMIAINKNRQNYENSFQSYLVKGPGIEANDRVTNVNVIKQTNNNIMNKRLTRLPRRASKKK